MPVDPVCGMQVDPETAVDKNMYGGVEYYFCSMICSEKFSSDPARYAGEKFGGELMNPPGPKS